MSSPTHPTQRGSPAPKHPVSYKRGSLQPEDFKRLSIGGTRDPNEWRRRVSVFEEVLGLASEPIALRHVFPQAKRPGQKYTSDDITERNVYILYGLDSRKVSPRSKELLVQWRKALSKVKDDESLDNLRQVSDLEDFLKTRADLRSVVGDEDADLANGVTRLLNSRLLARYGDYLAYFLKSVRKRAGDLQIEGRETLFKDVERENKIWTEVLKDINNDPEQAQNMKRVSDLLGIPLDYIMEALKAYAQRNEEVHSGMLEVLKAYDWPALADLCNKDLKNLPKFIPNQDKHDLYKEAILAVRDRWVYEKKETGKWLPTKEACDKMAAEAKQHEQREERRQEASEDFGRTPQDYENKAKAQLKKEDAAQKTGDYIKQIIAEKTKLRNEKYALSVKVLELQKMNEELNEQLAAMEQ